MRRSRLMSASRANCSVERERSTDSQWTGSQAIYTERSSAVEALICALWRCDGLGVYQLLWGACLCLRKR